MTGQEVPEFQLWAFHGFCTALSTVLYRKTVLLQLVNFEPGFTDVECARVLIYKHDGAKAKHNVCCPGPPTHTHTARHTQPQVGQKTDLQGADSITDGLRPLPQRWSRTWRGRCMVEASRTKDGFMTSATNAEQVSLRRFGHEQPGLGCFSCSPTGLNSVPAAPSSCRAVPNQLTHHSIIS